MQAAATKNAKELGVDVPAAEIAPTAKAKEQRMQSQHGKVPVRGKNRTVVPGAGTHKASGVYTKNGNNTTRRATNRTWGPDP